MKLFILTFMFALSASLLGWVVRDTVRQVGWRVLGVKSALCFNYIVLSLIVILPQLNWKIPRPEEHFVFSSNASVFLVVLTFVCIPILESRRATRWLLKAPVEWWLYSGAALNGCLVNALGYSSGLTQFLDKVSR